MTPRHDPAPPPVSTATPGAPWHRLVGWPPRRRFGAAGFTAATLAGYLADRGSTTIGSSLVAVASAAVAGLVIASYLPAGGTRRLDVGCSPCATMAAATVMGSFVLRSTAPGDLGIAVVALGLLVFGLFRRLTDLQTCRI
jgi:hypothetical protein